MSNEHNSGMESTACKSVTPTSLFYLNSRDNFTNAIGFQG